ncbi:MAG TPA: hypothetical protein VMM12_10505 [Longimicrobiales bacterium]|nr:hypothetical protein [Longimicrobiales bacterium]
MALKPETAGFLKYLNGQPTLRSRIRAAPDRTLLYAGSFNKPMWKEIADLKRANPDLAALETLPEVLARVPAPASGHANLLDYIKDLEDRVRIPFKPDGFAVWRSVSGIFAANAVGKVSFQIGSGVTAVDKVFAATEVAVLRRNPNIHPVSRDLLEYYARCIAAGQSQINVGFTA